MGTRISVSSRLGVVIFLIGTALVLYGCQGSNRQQSKALRARPKDWQPSSFSPKTGLLYIPHQNLCTDAEEVEANYSAGTPYIGSNAVPNGVAPGPGPNDNMILDIQNGNRPSGFGHPTCKGGQPPEEIIKQLVEKYPIGPKQ